MCLLWYNDVIINIHGLYQYIAENNMDRIRMMNPLPRYIKQC